MIESEKKSSPTPEQLARMQHAAALYRCGKLNDAAVVYDSLLAEMPDNITLLTNLGTIALRQGNLEIGLRLLGKSLQIEPNQPLTYYNCGVALQNLQRWEDALTSYHCAISLDPGYVQAYLNRGNVLQALKRFDEAVASYKSAIELRPDFAVAYSNCGNALQALHRQEDALTYFDRAISLHPGYAEAYSNRGNALKDLQRFEQALTSFDTAISLNPGLAEAYSNRGLALQEMNKLDDALSDFDRAIALNLDFAEAHFNKANVLQKLNPTNGSDEFDRAIAANPNFADAYLNKAMLKLLNGEFEEGWKLYEWRWKALARGKRYNQPLWLGEQCLKNKTLFIYAEQGLGDVLQFCRYLPMAAALGGKIIFEAPTPLLNLLSTLKAPLEFVEQGQLPLFDFDYHCPLLSLPLAFKTTLDNIPGKTPYLFADPDKKAAWRNKLGTKTKPRIGLVWQGGYRPNQPHTWAVNQRRNVKLSFFSIFGLLELEFYSLQKGETAQAELQELKKESWEGPEIQDFTTDLVDFADTAALIEHLDLVISVDTSTLHLAAALGKETWLLNRYDTCWRWLRNRDDSPWYPTLRQFRQTEAGEWRFVLEAVKSALIEKFSNGKNG